MKKGTLKGGGKTHRGDKREYEKKRDLGAKGTFEREEKNTTLLLNTHADR